MRESMREGMRERMRESERERKRERRKGIEINKSKIYVETKERNEEVHQ